MCFWSTSATWTDRHLWCQAGSTKGTSPCHCGAALHHLLKITAMPMTGKRQIRAPASAWARSSVWSGTEQLISAAPPREADGQTLRGGVPERGETMASAGPPGTNQSRVPAGTRGWLCTRGSLCLDFIQPGLWRGLPRRPQSQTGLVGKLARLQRHFWGTKSKWQLTCSATPHD